MKHNKIISILIACVSIQFTNAQTNNSLGIDISSIKTPLKANAIGIGINYLKQFNGIEQQINSSNGFLSFSPEIVTQAGTSDAFSQIQAKLSGYFLKGKVIELAGLKTIDTKATLHLFPISVGAESNGNFSFVNTLAEVGYIPYYQATGNKTVSEFLKHTTLSFFVQAGYKNKLDTANALALQGGKIDASAEAFNSTIFRFKTHVTIDTKNFFTNTTKPGIGLIGKATYWYDFMNKQIYYNLQAKCRLYLTPTQFFDVTYDKGSGAPNFNQGEQFTTGLSIQF